MEFCGLVKELFNTLYVMDGVMERYDISAIEEIYDRHPGGGNGCHLLLVRE